MKHLSFLPIFLTICHVSLAIHHNRPVSLEYITPRDAPESFNVSRLQTQWIFDYLPWDQTITSSGFELIENGTFLASIYLRYNHTGTLMLTYTGTQSATSASPECQLNIPNSDNLNLTSTTCSLYKILMEDTYYIKVVKEADGSWDAELIQDAVSGRHVIGSMRLPDFSNRKGQIKFSTYVEQLDWPKEKPQDVKYRRCLPRYRYLQVPMVLQQYPTTKRIIVENLDWQCIPNFADACGPLDGMCYVENKMKMALVMGQ